MGSSTSPYTYFFAIDKKIWKMMWVPYSCWKWDPLTITHKSSEQLRMPVTIALLLEQTKENLEKVCDWTKDLRGCTTRLETQVWLRLWTNSWLINLQVEELDRRRRAWETMIAMTNSWGEYERSKENELVLLD